MKNADNVIMLTVSGILRLHSAAQSHSRIAQCGHCQRTWRPCPHSHGAVAGAHLTNDETPTS